MLDGVEIRPGGRSRCGSDVVLLGGIYGGSSMSAVMLEGVTSVSLKWGHSLGSRNLINGHP